MKTLISVSLLALTLSLTLSASSRAAAAGGGEDDLGGTFYCDNVKAEMDAAQLAASVLQDDVISCLYCLQGEVFNCFLTPPDEDGSCTSYWEVFDDANEDYRYWSRKWKNQCERRRIW